MKMNEVQNEVKKLMQNHIKTNMVTKEIDSPYAKYNSRGLLMCIVCGVPVKSKIIWQAHVNKKSHKEILLRLKEKQEKISKLQYQKQEKSKKRPLSPGSLKKLSKQPKLEVKPKGILKNLNTYSSSEEEESGDESGADETQTAVKQEIKQELDANSLDPAVPSSSSQQPHKPNAKGVTPPSKGDTLPEGFFDDPVADAKARNVEYRDKDAAEWESFLKEVSAAELESRQIIAEDKEEAAFETQLEQTHDQIKCLQRIVELDRAKTSQLSERKGQARGRDSDQESSDEEFSPVIWRTKNCLI